MRLFKETEIIQIKYLMHNNNITSNYKFPINLTASHWFENCYFYKYICIMVYEHLNKNFKYLCSFMKINK